MSDVQQAASNTGGGSPKAPAQGCWPVRKLFSNLFWPAAAGNVFWAFCTEIVDQLPDQFAAAWPLWWFFAGEFAVDWDVVSRLLVLFFLAVYLSIAWIRTAVTKTTRFRYWVFDFVHLWTIIFAALSAQFAPDFLGAFLVVLFAWGTLGHCTGSFALFETEAEPYQQARESRFRYGGVNFVGIVILAGGRLADGLLIAMPASVLSVIVVWLWKGRFGDIKQAMEKLDNE